MKIFFILLLISVFLSSCFLTIYALNYCDFKQENKKLNIVLNRILPFATCLSILLFMITIFTIDFRLGIMIIAATFIANILLESEFAILLSGIFAILLCLLLPISKFDSHLSINNETNQVITLYNCSDDENYNSIIINISELDDSETKLYTIMEYNKDDAKDLELPSTLKEINNFKITKEGENKLIITKKIDYKNSFLSYLGLFKPYSLTNITYTLYINEDNVKHIKED